MNRNHRVLDFVVIKRFKSYPLSYMFWSPGVSRSERYNYLPDEEGSPILKIRYLSHISPYPSRKEMEQSSVK